MCDTFVATRDVTYSNVAIFAKNSDRPPNEAQHLVQIPSKKFSVGDFVQCTYIKIPQVESTNAVLLSQPYWMWGAEIGVNEHGLAIGNEAVFSKVPANKEPALLGMDLLRLGLERAATPQEAIQIIVELLEKYGQGGNCVNIGELYYHNTFLLANSDETWVLETIDRQWAAKKVEGTYSISNVLTLEESWDRASDGLVEHALKNKVARVGEPLNIAENYSDFLITTFSKARDRCDFTKQMMDTQKGELDVSRIIEILRSHNGKMELNNGLADIDVCMHAGFGPIRRSQSTASMVVYLGEIRPTIFATGTSAPCTGIFKPFWVDAQLPDMGPNPTSFYDEKSLFWSHERLHRLVLENPGERLAVYTDERDALETEFIKGALELEKALIEERAKFSAKCLAEVIEAEDRWLEKVQKVTAKKSILSSINNMAWGKYNRDAKIML